MKNLTGFLPALIILAASCATSNKEVSQNTITLANQSKKDRNEVVEIDASLFPEVVNSAKIGIGKVGNVPVEGIDHNNDGSVDRLLVKVSIPASKSINLDFATWQPDTGFTKKTQAEISKAVGGEWKEQEYLGGTSFENIDFLTVPDSHTDHSWYIRYEGPGWENELIGYRFYLDWRNAVDIFGKKVDTLVLQQVGQDGFDSYHEEEDWGMDILKAGKSLGIGSIGRVNNESVVEHFEETDSVTCEIILNGHLSSRIETNYYGWETGSGTADMKSVLSINSGDRATTHKVSFDSEVNNFCTGIVKHPKGAFFQASFDEWGYIATFGTQTLFDDNLGMAIFYRQDQLQKIDTTDAYNYQIVFKSTQQLEYQFLGAWEKEPNGIKTRETFEAYLNQKLDALNSPIEVK